MAELTQEQQEVFDELERLEYIFIPSRKSVLMTEDLWHKRQILKELVYMDLISFDFSIANPNDETSETCLVFTSRKLIPKPQRREDGRFTHLPLGGGEDWQRGKAA